MPTQDQCTSCGRALAWGRYEASFRLPSGRVRDLVEVPGCVCATCGLLFVDPRLMELAGLTDARCIMAIESERSAGVRIAMRSDA